MKKGYIILESGEAFEGRWLGGTARGGEVVFNTSHSGYEEIATDPSYFNQIMVMTASQQGNYGVHKKDWESSKLHIQGLVVTEMQNSERDSTWLKALTEEGIPVLDQVDTRRLVLTIREKGTPWGALVCADSAEDAAKSVKNLVAERKKIDLDWTFQVSRKKSEFLKGLNPSGPRVAILDYGVKENSIRELVKRCSEVSVFPGRTDARTLLEWSPDGFLLSNGPGNPADVQNSLEVLKDILGVRPVFGICMGHQLLAQALGAKTYKLRFGHRGGNHPVRDLLMDQVYMTSQNHGYAVDDSSLPSHTKRTHINLYDQTNEGIECVEKKCFSVQYHPESCPGPQEANSLFDLFIGRLR